MISDLLSDPHGQARVVEWLIGERRAAVLLPSGLGHRLLHELLGHTGFAEPQELLRELGETPMFLAYHRLCPPGTRIFTLSGKAAMPLLYQVMVSSPMTVGD
ncbi:MAG: hypothetical protein JNL84_05045 [Candidatus Accumulibacter sp.]|nr:hypothetical protein [Accumulibacter sp.]